LRPRWLAASRDLLRAVREHFGAADGSFYMTADDQEQLVARTKAAQEGSIPSGIAAAIGALLRAGLLLGDEAFYAAAETALDANSQLLTYVDAVPSLVLAELFRRGDPREVVVAGEPGEARTEALLAATWREFDVPHVTALVHGGNREALEELSPVFVGKDVVDGAPAAYVCRRGTCRAPVTDPAKVWGDR
jgi:uncharacterized protein YyaL (SSP411 family)